MTNNTTNKTEIKAKGVTVSELENQINVAETNINNLSDELFRLKNRLRKYDVLLKTSDTARGKWRISQ
jgi:septal ring factor EnvC (AmiA/AmiB activator)